MCVKYSVLLCVCVVCELCMFVEVVVGEEGV